MREAFAAAIQNALDVVAHREKHLLVPVVKTNRIAVRKMSRHHFEQSWSAARHGVTSSLIDIA
jgi:hypothetical protein